jgi:phosphatidylserine/phosphatidylglycerophosphate/cardiolipin synthase-like enzyme
MTSERTPHVEFVITVPEPFGAELAYRARARTSLGVLAQLISQAERYLVIAAPYIQSGGAIDAGPLADALRAALQRGVNVDIVSTGGGLQAVDVERLRRTGRGQVRLFQPHANVEDEGRLGSHAKFCIADDWHAYIGSANLTGPGLSTNLEMGVLVHGGLASQVREFWMYLRDVGFFVEVG